MRFETSISRTQRGSFAGRATRSSAYGRKVRSFRKEDDEEGAEVFYRPGKFAVVKGKEMREFSYSTTERGSRSVAKSKAFKCASEWCGMAKRSVSARRRSDRIRDKAQEMREGVEDTRRIRAHEGGSDDAKNADVDDEGKPCHWRMVGGHAMCIRGDEDIDSAVERVFKKNDILMKPDSVADHELWEKAKAAADRQKDPDDYYALVNSIYQKMGGKFVAKKSDDLGMSMRDIESAIRSAVNVKWGVRSYVEQIYPDADVAIVHVYPNAPMYGGPYDIAGDTQKNCLRVPYEVSENEVVLGEAEEVKQVWVPLAKALEALAKNVEEYGADDATFSARVKAKLDSCDLTEVDLAQRSGIPEETLTQMLQGKLAWDRTAKLRVSEVVQLQTSEWMTKAMHGDDYADHARRMRRQMEKQGLTVADLADECDMDEERVAKAIQGGKVSGEEMESLKYALGMGKATRTVASPGTSEVFKGYRTEGGSFLFELAKADRARVANALLNDGEDAEETEDGVELRKDVEGNEIEVKLEKSCGQDEDGKFGEGNSCATGEGGGGGGGGSKLPEFKAGASHDIDPKDISVIRDELKAKGFVAGGTAGYGKGGNRETFRNDKEGKAAHIDTYQKRHKLKGKLIFRDLGDHPSFTKSFPGVRLPHTNSFFFPANGSSESLAKALRDTGACKTCSADLFGVTVEFEKSVDKDDVEVLCKDKDEHGYGSWARGEGPSGGDEGKEVNDHTIQKHFDKVTASVRADGSRTYTSMTPSPNLKGGTRHFIDVENKDKSKQQSHADKIQREMDKKASSIRSSVKGSETYTSMETSPNMGMRVFMDVKLPKGMGKSEIPLLKADTAELSKAKERGIVYGVAYEPNKTDLQNEYANEDDVRKAAEDFMSNPQVRVQHGKMSKSKVVFSYVTEKGDRVLGKEWTPGTWIVGVKLDDEGRKLYKAGKVTGFSMGGTKRFAVN